MDHAFLKEESNRPLHFGLLGQGCHGQEELQEVGVSDTDLDETVAFRLQQVPEDVASLLLVNMRSRYLSRFERS